VDGLGAHYTDDVLFTMYDNALSGQGFGVEATERVKTDEAFFIDMGNDEGDFVHVGGHHHLLA